MMKAVVKSITILAAILLALPQCAWAGTSVESGFGFSQAMLASGRQPWALGPRASLGVSVDLNECWRVRTALAWRRLWDDTESEGAFKFPDPDGKASRAWTQSILSVTALRILGRRGFSPYIGAGAGWASWRVEKYPGYSALTPGDHRADEIGLSAVFGVQPELAGPLHLQAEIVFDYLTGIGARFAESFEDERSRGHLSLNIGLSIPLTGHGPTSLTVPAESGITPVALVSPVDPASVAPVSAPPVDADADGVNDRDDQCPITPVGAVVDGHGCPLDSDGDGVFDGLDLCPATAEAERAYVDSSGCVDSMRVHAHDSLVSTDTMAVAGPPLPQPSLSSDGDGDGIPDSLDRCPDTPSGLEVDSAGCLVMTQLDRRLILHVSYVSGTTEMDPFSVRIISDLAVRLKARPDIQATIEGFTDDIGEAEANRKVSQKRADRVKSHFVRLGIPASRLTAVGRGETKFIADNATALGRRRNRRIEITFTTK